MSEYGNILAAVHLHDNDGINDDHLLPLHPKGTIDWNDKITKLKSTELFGRMITLEAGIEGDTLRDGFENALEIAKKLASI